MERRQMQLYQYRAEMLKALANPIRIAIVDFLGDNERCVCDIVDFLGEKQSGVSRHLATLRNAGIVEARKEGLNIYYRVKTPCVINFFTCTDKIIREQYEEREEIIKIL